MSKRGRSVNFNRTAFLYVNEILHDIDAELLKFSKLIAVDGTPNEELQTDETDSNRPLMLRRVAYHVGQLGGTMQAYVMNVEKKVSDNVHHSVEEYEFKLSFPENWNSSAFLRLPMEMHSYVVNGCIADFLKSSMPNESSVYQSVADASLWNVKHCITSRRPESLRQPTGWF